MTTHNSEQSWFLAQIKPNCAQIAKRNLKQQGFQTFLPLEQSTQTRNGKFVSVTRPIFPGYIFISFDVTQGLWRKIHSTFGISRLVSFGKEPSAVPSNIMHQLISRSDEGGQLLPSQTLEIGDMVRLTTGPFTDIFATIEQVDPNQRAWVLMDIMSGQKRVAVNTNQLRAV